MKNQDGATLIVILVVLVLVTVLGTIAIRSSIVGLKIATNSQVNVLLMENSDSALFNIENPNQVERQMALDGMFAYFNSAANANDQLVFCYRSAETSFFQLAKASAIGADGSITKIGIDGFCKANQFSAGRSAVLSQIYLSKNSTPSQPFSNAPKGTSLGQSSVLSASNNIGATVISILPSFSGASSTAIEGCFKLRASDVGACFENLSIPYNMQHSDYIVGGQPKLIS